MLLVTVSSVEVIFPTGKEVSSLVLEANLRFPSNFRCVAFVKICTWWWKSSGDLKGDSSSNSCLWCSKLLSFSFSRFKITRWMNKMAQIAANVNNKIFRRCLRLISGISSNGFQFSIPFFTPREVFILFVSTSRFFHAKTEISPFMQFLIIHLKLSLQTAIYKLCQSLRYLVLHRSGTKLRTLRIYLLNSAHVWWNVHVITAL